MKHLSCANCKKMFRSVAALKSHHVNNRCGMLKNRPTPKIEYPKVPQTTLMTLSPSMVKTVSIETSPMTSGTSLIKSETSSIQSGTSLMSSKTSLMTSGTSSVTSETSLSSKALDRNKFNDMWSESLMTSSSSSRTESMASGTSLRLSGTSLIPSATNPYSSGTSSILSETSLTKPDMSSS